MPRGARVVSEAFAWGGREEVVVSRRGRHTVAIAPTPQVAQDREDALPTCRRSNRSPVSFAFGRSWIGSRSGNGNGNRNRNRNGNGNGIGIGNRNGNGNGNGN